MSNNQVKPHTWIKVSNALPVHDEQVLVTVERPKVADYPNKFVFMAYYSADLKGWLRVSGDDNNLVEYVTHWMRIEFP